MYIGYINIDIKDIYSFPTGISVFSLIGETSINLTFKAYQN